MPKALRDEKETQQNKKSSKYNWANFVLAICCWAWSLPLSVGGMLSETPMETANFSFTNYYLLTISSGSGRKLVSTSTQCWSPIWLRPVQALCTLPQSPWLHLYVSPVLARRSCLLGVLHPTGSYTISTSSSSGFFELSGERFVGDIPFRTECSKVSHSPRIVQLQVSVFVMMPCRRKLVDTTWLTHMCTHRDCSSMHRACTDLS